MIGLLAVAGAAQAETVPVPEKKPEYCKVLPKTRGAEYQPGVDVHGKPVVPAEVDVSPVEFPEFMQVPVEIDLAERFGIDVPEGAELKPEAAFVTVYQDGKVEYNGQDVSSAAYSVCGSGQWASEAIENTDEQSDKDSDNPDPR